MHKVLLSAVLGLAASAAAWSVLDLAAEEPQTVGKLRVKCAAEKQHPVVFFPGLFGSRLEERLDIPPGVVMPSNKCPRKSKGWEPAWVEWRKILPLTQFDCLCERMRMAVDPLAQAPRNTEGVEVRVPHWGTVASVDPLSQQLGKVVRMYGPAMDALKRMGYAENRTLFVAAYDWRMLPRAEWMQAVRALVERAVEAAGGRKAVLFAHSMGCPVSYMFLMAQEPAWRARYVAHYVPVAPVWTGTNIVSYAMATNRIFNYTGPYSYLGQLFRDLEGMYLLAPSVVFDADSVVASTDTQVYTAANVSRLLERMGVPRADETTRNVQRALSAHNYEHPGVPVTTVWSVGGRSTLGAFHWKKDADVGVQEPLFQLVEGDVLVPRTSLEYAYHRWRAGPLANITTGVQLTKSNHATISHDDRTLLALFHAACDE